jgi:hypothetical protein
MFDKFRNTISSSGVPAIHCERRLEPPRGPLRKKRLPRPYPVNYNSIELGSAMADPEADGAFRISAGAIGIFRKGSFPCVAGRLHVAAIAFVVKLALGLYREGG